MTFSLILLAAGKGRRMNSSLPKVLHLFHGVPMIVRIIQEVLELSPKFIYIVVGENRCQIQKVLEEFFPSCHFLYIDQLCPLGTGDAVRQCLPYLEFSSQILILNGDIPNIKSMILRDLTQTLENKIIGFKTDNENQYGKIIIDEYGNVKNIIEHCETKDETSTLVNAGIYFLNSEILRETIPHLRKHNTEFYFTDIFSMCYRKNILIQSDIISSDKIPFVSGVNTQEELQKLEKH